MTASITICAALMAKPNSVDEGLSRSQTYIVAGSPLSTPRLELKDLETISDVPVGESVTNGRFKVIHDEKYYTLIDLVGLGISFIYGLADALQQVARNPESADSKPALERAVMPMIWSPFQKRHFSQISELELSSGFTLTARRKGSNQKRSIGTNRINPIVKLRGMIFPQIGAKVFHPHDSRYMKSNLGSMGNS